MKKKSVQLVTTDTTSSVRAGAGWFLRGLYRDTDDDSRFKTSLKGPLWVRKLQV